MVSRVAINGFGRIGDLATLMFERYL